MFLDISLSYDFLEMTSKTQERKIKISKQDYIKPKNFCTIYGTRNTMKRQPTEQEKIFANDANDKGLISKHRQLNIRKQTKKHNKKWAENLNRHFSKEDIQMFTITKYQRNANQHHSEVPPHIGSEWSSSKSLHITSAGEDVEEKEPR